MPSQEYSHQYDDAILWVFAGRDAYNEPTVSSPVEVRLRWDDKSSEVIAPDGTVVKADATVITSRDVPIGSILWKGTLEDIPGTSFTPTSGLMYSVSQDYKKDVKARATARTVGLMRFNNQLPAIAP